MGRVIYVSGPRASGVGELLMRLQGAGIGEIFTPSHRERKEHEDHFSQQIWRMGRFYLDAREAEDEAERNGSVLLMEHSPFDEEAFTSVLRDLGCISHAQALALERQRESYFDDGFPGAVIIVHPPEEEVVRELKRRHDETKPWGEEEFEYLRLLREQYLRIHERERARRRMLLLEAIEPMEQLRRVGAFVAKIMGPIDARRRE